MIEPGLADLRAGRDTTAARAVLVARTRLVEAGLEAPPPELPVPAAHLLYESLAREYGVEAHARYNAILRRIASYCRALELASPG